MAVEVMSAEKQYAPTRCGRHGDTIVDILNDDGSISHECKFCCGSELVLVNIVRQLHRRVEAKGATG